MHIPVYNCHQIHQVHHLSIFIDLIFSEMCLNFEESKLQEFEQGKILNENNLKLSNLCCFCLLLNADRKPSNDLNAFAIICRKTFNFFEKVLIFDQIFFLSKY